MKTAYPNHEALAAAWAEKKLAEGHTFRGGNMLATSEAIYSWGTHFMIARHWKGHILFSERVYGTNSTVKHKSKVWNALRYNPARVINVPTLDDGPPETCSRGWVDSLVVGARKSFEQAKRARTIRAYRVASVYDQLNHAALLSETFDAPLPSSPDWLMDFFDLAVVELFKAKCDGDNDHLLSSAKLHPCYKVAPQLGDMGLQLAA